MSFLSSDFPAIIPALRSNQDETQRTRNVIICCDGTGDSFDLDNSNVVKLFAALKKDDPTQVCYYQSGIGTYSDSYKGSLKSGFSAGLDMAVGASLGLHIRDAYSFLMQNYREGDKIALIGFSRGAYTARCLAGMLHKVGLLPAHNQAQIAFAYKWYKDDSANGWSMSAEFKRTFSIDVKVHFMGCWDTVASVGIIPRILPFAKTENPSVRYFRHAIALDERRSKFKQNHWFQRDELYHDLENRNEQGFLDGNSSAFEHALSAHHEHMSKLGSPMMLTPIANEPETIVFDPEKIFKSLPKKDESNTKQDICPKQRHQRRSSILPFKRQSSNSYSEDGKVVRGDGKSYNEFQMMRKFNEVDRKQFGDYEGPTDFKEVLFCGNHADVGGGAVPNDTRHMLSRIPLRWMIREMFQCNTGMLFHADVLAEHGLDLESLFPQYQPRKAPVCSPPPSALDEYAMGTLPSLKNRRDSVRRQLACNEMGPNNNLRETQAKHVKELFSSHSSTDNSCSNSIRSLTDVRNELPMEMNRSPSTMSNWRDTGILPELHEDYFDSLADMNDQLKLSKSWWILELWPIKYRVKTHLGVWKKKLGPNLGRHRTIRTKEVNVHWTVIQRQENTDYRIKCGMNDDCQWNVVY